MVTNLRNTRGPRVPSIRPFSQILKLFLLLLMLPVKMEVRVQKINMLICNYGIADTLYTLQNAQIRVTRHISLIQVSLTFTQISQMSLLLLMLPVKMELIDFSVQKIWNQRFLFVTPLISIRTTYFHLDDYPTLSPTPSKWY